MLQSKQNSLNGKSIIDQTTLQVRFLNIENNKVCT